MFYVTCRDNGLIVSAKTLNDAIKKAKKQAPADFHGPCKATPLKKPGA